MPELADVEAFRRVFNDNARGMVRAVHVHDRQVVRRTTPHALSDAVRGRRFGQAWRHGKWLVAPLAGRRSDTAVLLHFGMTGELVWSDRDEEPHRHDRVVFEFDHGQLRYRDMRKLEGLHLARDAAERRAVLGDLGADAADMSRDELCQLLTSKNRQLKALLLDQSEIAGLGNLLVDETLWRARLHPRTPSATLGEQDCKRLHARMRTVLRQSADAGRVPPRPSWLTGHRDERPGTCPRCGTSLSHGTVGGRSGVWCPRCQPEPDGAWS